MASKELVESSRPSRRDFLKATGVGALSVGLPLTASATQPAARSSEKAVILLTMVGGPSQLETFDPKPQAPSAVRGPFSTIATSIPGIRVVEHLPLVARRLHRLTLVRSLQHDSAPIHETGLQLLGTGQLCRPGSDHPHLGSVVARELGASGGLPPFVVLPRVVGHTGVCISNGQSAATLGTSFEPFVLNDDPASDSFNPSTASDRAFQFLDQAEALRGSGNTTRSSRRAFDLSEESAMTRSAYGHNTFGQSCLLARRLVESGSRMVVINMSEGVFNQPSWDAHGASPFSRFADYAEILLPAFDRGFSALVDDLEKRGLLGSTLVVASGEMGRSPRINAQGGRDHWTSAWSALMAGGDLDPGRVIGSTDAQGAEVVDYPLSPAALHATMAQHLGLSSSRPGLPS